MKKLTVPFVNVAAQFIDLEDELVDAFTQVGRSGMYVMGEQVSAFEQGLAKLCHTQFALSVANGTDALILALKALDIGAGDEVITAPNSFIASAGAIAAVGATIRFADVGEDFNLDIRCVEQAITDKTKAIIAVHLTGNPADMASLKILADKYQLKIIEDAAQAIGASYQGRMVGSLSDVACFSLHPLKNFHLLGDAGFITTNNAVITEKIKLLRNHGLFNRDESALWGLNSRCDTLQAALGLVKLPHFSRWTARFQQIAARYQQLLHQHVCCPVWSVDNSPVFHNFVIQVDDREKVMEQLAKHGVDSKIHYPIPLHLMPAAKTLGYQLGDFPVAESQAKRILSLPIYPELTDSQVDYVAEQVIAAVSN